MLPVGYGRKVPVFITLLLLFTVISVVMGAPGPTLTVDFNAEKYPISPYIYGMNFADADLAAEIGIPVSRWGGNATTRYNWQIDVSNRAADYFYENIPDNNPNPENLPDGSGADLFVEQNISTGTDSLMVMPMIGWTPKARQDHPFDCGFKVSKYGAQQQTDPWDPDCGNGIKPNGDPVEGNDPLDTSIPIDETFVQAWITHLKNKYGAADNGGVKFYNLDNEPFLWNETHRDVHPEPLSYDGIRDLTYQYAAAIKAADPAAQVLGPGEWGWTGYFYSALDWEPGGDWWNHPQDRLAHGDVPLVEWYLQQMQAYETEHGVRILDYLDEHYYPQNGVALNENVDDATAALRLESTRSLWDPTYLDTASWIDEPIYMIPRMRQWVADNYPGTKIAIGEYNYGALTHINGALAQADVLGIFGRERLDLATLWDPPQSNTDPGAFAFRMYLNYDGAGGKFGDMSVNAVSTNQSQLAIYAAHRTADNALTLMVINKTGDTLTSTVQLNGFNPSSAAQVYRYSKADLNAIQHLSDQAVTAAGFSADFPKNSITLFVIPNGAAATELLVNNSFEIAGETTSAADWAEKNLVKDKRKCNKAGKPPFAHAGNCAFQFTGTPGVKSSITQQPDGSAILAGDTLTLSAWVYAKKLSGAGKVLGKVKFADSTKLKLKLAVAPGSYPYGLLVDSDQAAGTPTGIKVVIKMNNGGGKFFIDGISLGLTPAADVPRNADTLPLPLEANSALIPQQ